MRIACVGDSLTEGVPGSSYFALLRARLPGHALVNLGAGNETVVSLHRRLARTRFGQPFDAAFLWIGVNDVVRGSPWPFRLATALWRKPPSRNREEFAAHYRAALDLLCRHARRVFAVSLPLKGEDAGNLLNRELDVLSSLIEELAGHAGAEYLDVRRVFVRHLAGQPISGYLPTNAIRVALDALLLRSDEQIDRRSAARGLHLTLDGVHLNSTGARLVADCFAAAIERMRLEGA